MEVPGTPSADSLLVFSPRYLRLAEGRYAFEAPRPSPEGGARWHRHDWSVRRPLVLIGGVLARVVVLQRRWRLAGTQRTRLDRPPALLPRRPACTLLLSLLLLGLLTAPTGLHRSGAPAPAGRSLRQLQRDLAAACALAEHTQQAVRATLIDFSEPRPAESLTKEVRGPPDELTRRCRHAGATVLWRALRMLQGSAGQLEVHTAHLLVEARGRWLGPYRRFLI